MNFKIFLYKVFFVLFFELRKRIYISDDHNLLFITYKLMGITIHIVQMITGDNIYFQLYKSGNSKELSLFNFLVTIVVY